MKFPLLVYAAVSCVILSWSESAPSSSDPELSESTKRCMVQENIDSEYLVGFKSGKIKPENVSEVFKCFVRCVVEAKGYMKDGQVLEEQVIKGTEGVASSEKVHKIISSCVAEESHSTNVCEKSFNIYMCVSGKLK